MEQYNILQNTSTMEFKVLYILEVYKGIMDAVNLPCKGEFLNCIEKQLGISAKVVSSYNTSSLQHQLNGGRHQTRGQKDLVIRGCY